MCKEEEREMLKLKEYKESTSKKQIGLKSARKLIERKKTINCENGVVQIDSSHPDYKFWMED